MLPKCIFNSSILQFHHFTFTTNDNILVIFLFTNLFIDIMALGQFFEIKVIVVEITLIGDVVWLLVMSLPFLLLFFLSILLYSPLFYFWAINADLVDLSTMSPGLFIEEVRVCVFDVVCSPVCVCDVMQYSRKIDDFIVRTEQDESLLNLQTIWLIMYWIHGLEYKEGATIYSDLVIRFWNCIVSRSLLHIYERKYRLIVLAQGFWEWSI